MWEKGGVISLGVNGGRYRLAVIDWLSGGALVAINKLLYTKPG